MSDETENQEVDNSTSEGAGDEGEQAQGPSPEILAKARDMGWSPKDKFRGDPSKWVDADKYVERGETVLPIIRKNNERLQNQLTQASQENSALKTQLQELQDSVAAMQQIQVRETAGRLERQIRLKRKEIETARADRETDQVVSLTEELDALVEEKEKISKPAEKKVEKKTEVEDKPDAQLERDFQDWQADNEWFGGSSKEDKTRTRLANAIAVEMRRDPEWKGVVGRKFLDEVTRQVADSLGESEEKPQVSKTSGGSQSGNRAGSGATKKGKGISDLPPEARRAMEQDIERLVGPNKVFKKPEEYHKFYVDNYFGDEE